RPYGSKIRSNVRTAVAEIGRSKNLGFTNDECLRSRLQRNKLAGAEPGVREHLLQLIEGVGVALLRAREHRETEPRGRRRRYAVLVRYELHCCSASIGL